MTAGADLAPEVAFTGRRWAAEYPIAAHPMMASTMAVKPHLRRVRAGAAARAIGASSAFANFVRLRARRFMRLIVRAALV
jgi:hypothetical protein